MGSAVGRGLGSRARPSCYGNSACLFCVSRAAPEEVQAEVDVAVSLRAGVRAKLLTRHWMRTLARWPSGSFQYRMDLVSTALIEIWDAGFCGSRPVEARASARRIFQDETAYAFAPDVTLQDIDALVEAGAVVEVVKAPMAADALPMCAVSTEAR